MIRKQAILLRSLLQRTIALLTVSALAVMGSGCQGCSDGEIEFPGPVEVRQEKSLIPDSDLTFLVAADTHFGARDIEQRNRLQVEAMNSIAGTPWPRSIGGTVDTPALLLMAGDMTDHGLPSEWAMFEKYYGLTGSDGLLQYPVYACIGNHDRALKVYTPVASALRKRHGGLTYSWDVDDVHFVCLGEYPSEANTRWLREDLADVGRQVPIVIFFHYSVLGPFSQWWDAPEKKLFARTIEGFNVVAIFHGHYHGSGHYRWAGVDVFNVGSPRHGNHTFCVVRITDERLVVGAWGWDPPDESPLWAETGWQWIHAEKLNEPGRSSAETRSGPLSR